VDGPLRLYWSAGASRPCLQAAGRGKNRHRRQAARKRRAEARKLARKDDPARPQTAAGALSPRPATR